MLPLTCCAVPKYHRAAPHDLHPLQSLNAMTEPRKGSRFAISPARAMVLELLHHARYVPSLPLGKTFDVSQLMIARRAARAAPSWTAIFMRAYGLLTRSWPELRRAYIPYPWPHYYEHPESNCAILVERAWRGEQVVLGAKIRSPETTPLAVIDDHLRVLRDTPVEEVSSFRQILRLGRLPGPLRRFTMWQSLYLSGYKRAKRLGTFMMSSLGNLGVEQFHPLTPLTTYLTFGPISPAGEVVVKIIYDHRVLDGRGVARCLNDLERILTTDLLLEMATTHQLTECA